ncbi:MAG: efflux RND transporter periplasmic adaptor subunit [Planctomycetia bacterium]|nr:efflux RND transporter periplasmic adaptor subunit [Planctomycetia bacterium]
MRWVGILACGIVLTAAAVALAFFGPFRGRAHTLRLPGVVEIQEVRLASKWGGRVAETAVLEGDLVAPGQLLVRFETPEMEAQKLQQEARVRLAEADWLKAKNGPRVEEIRYARSELEAADADLKLAREDYERADRLVRQGSLARAEYDLARAVRDRAHGRVAMARARHELLLAGTRTEEIEAAAATAQEARAKLKEIEANLAEAQVRAPEKCLIEVLAVRKGDVVPPNQPVVRVLRADDMWVKVYVAETDLGKVRLHQPVAVTCDSYPDRKFEGRVIHIASQSEFTPRNVQSIDERRHQVFGVKVRVADPQGVFKAGMAAEVLFDLAPPP